MKKPARVLSTRRAEANHVEPMNNIHWPKDIRERAKAKGEKLIAFGCPGMEMVGMADTMRVQVISLLYVNFICNRKSFDESLANVKETYPEHFQKG